jgi:hypothetical protein
MRPIPAAAARFRQMRPLLPAALILQVAVVVFVVRGRPHGRFDAPLAKNAKSEDPHAGHEHCASGVWWLSITLPTCTGALLLGGGVLLLARGEPGARSAVALCTPCALCAVPATIRRGGVLPSGVACAR